MNTLHLLYPEWQGCGRTPAAQEGALFMAATLLPDAPFTVIDSPAEERLERRDAIVGLDSIAPRFRAAMQAVRASAPDRIITIGGTCGVEAVPVAYLNDRYAGDLAVVWFDAHGDLNTPASSPSGNFNGMVLRTLLGEGAPEFVDAIPRRLTTRQIFLAATRDLDPPEVSYVESAGISVATTLELQDPGILVSRIRERGFTRVYLHMDLDALSPESFPDTLMRTPGGPTLGEVAAAAAAIRESFDVVGVSLLEYVRRTPGGSVDALRALAAAIL